MNKYILYDEINSINENQGISQYCKDNGLSHEVERALKNLEGYKKYFFETDKPMTYKEMGKKLKIRREFISEDIRLLKNELSILQFVEKRSAVKSEYKELTTFVLRLPYYIHNVIKKNEDVNIKVLSEKLGVSEEEVKEDIKKIKLFYNVDILKKYKNKSIFERIDYYIDNYFETFFPKSFSDIAKELKEDLSVIENELVFLRKFILPISENNSDKLKDRLTRFKIYNSYFLENEEVENLSVLSEDINLKIVDIQSDFEDGNLYMIFKIKNM